MYVFFAHLTREDFYIHTHGDFPKEIPYPYGDIAGKDFIPVFRAPHEMEAQVVNRVRTFVIVHIYLDYVAGSLKAPPKGGGLKPLA